ncbi:MAG: hypothetical protein QF491_13110 [Alphaproteobacteria bacterium]|jgi:hypothetical protein|nr:hypothetical protein [Alphaproteobacteria bacterium]
MAAFGDAPIFPETIGWEDVQAALEAQGLGDGLPLVPPTQARLDGMLAGVAEPERSHGQVPPLFGELTAAAVAYNCVLAGCRPGEMPIVLTAVEACLEERFNLLGILTTTGTPAVVVVVHGPLAGELGLNATTNCLGPGNRANACVGRAVSLVMRNIGGARANVGDMATMGQPGKYTFCFAEGDDRTFPELHVRRGFAAEVSAVTVLGVSGTAEVLPAGTGDTPESVLQPIAAAMHAAIAVSSAARKPDRGEQFFLLPPELARLLARNDWDLRRLQDYLFDGPSAVWSGTSGENAADPATHPVARGPDDIQPIITGGAGIKMTYLPLWAGGTFSVTRGVREFQG